MTAKSVFVVAGFVRAYPLDQILQIRVLLPTGTKFLRLPRSRAAVRHACLNSRVQKDELLAIWQYRRNNIRVTAFNYPAFIAFHEASYISETVLQ